MIQYKQTKSVVCYHFHFCFNVDIDYNLEEDEQLARALQESLNADSPPRQNIPVENVPSEPPRELPPILFASSGSRCLSDAM